jgi:hypothetical protein
MAETKKPSDTLRADHADLLARVNAIQATFGGLERLPPEDARAAMERIVMFLDDEIRPHTSWEEVRLYPVADRAVGGAQPFTADLRREHRTIDGAIDDLAVLAARPRLDVPAFARLGVRLFAALASHFDEEERLLLPVLDRALTADELRDAVGADPAAAHAH